MVRAEFDQELLVAAPIFTIGAAISTGFVSSSMLGIDLAATLVTFDYVEISVSRAMSILALLGVLVNRDSPIAQIRDLNVVEAWIAYATVGLVIAPPLLPIAEGTLAEPPVAFLSFVVQSIGFMIVSYMN